jgi:hypothetical protein
MLLSLVGDRTAHWRSSGKLGIHSFYGRKLQGARYVCGRVILSIVRRPTLLWRPENLSQSLFQPSYQCRPMHDKPHLPQPQIQRDRGRPICVH